jgi:Domain of unknown function (DUF4136)
MFAPSVIRSTANFVFTLMIAGLLAACSSSKLFDPKIFVNQDPAADFSQYRTYNYEAQLGTDERRGYRSILSTYLVDAMDIQMQQRGYTKSDNPDLLINFYVAKEQKIKATQTPTMVGGGYYGYRSGYYGAYGGYDTTVTQYTQGTLNIDLVDNRTKTLVWEGVAVGRVTDKARENAQLAVNSAVTDTMAKYAHVAPGFVLPPAVTE